MLSRVEEICKKFEGSVEMKGNGEFFNRIKKIDEPEIEKKIRTADAYTICDILEETKGGPNGIYLRQLENAIIETKDITQIYEFMFLAVDMNIVGFDRERFENLIRESKNSKLICYCMEFVPGVNIKLMLETLEEIQCAKYMEMLCKDDEYKDVFQKIKELDFNYEEKVEEAKKVDYYPKSLEQFRDFKNNIEQLKEKVKEEENPALITELANYLEYLNEYKGENYDISDLVLIQQELKDPMQAYEFLSSVNVQNKKGLIQEIINSGRVKFMYYVYEYVPELLEEEKKLLKENIIQKDREGKYKEKVEDTKGEEETRWIGQ